MSTSNLIKLAFIAGAFVSVLATGCKPKDDDNTDIDANKKGKLGIHLEHQVGGTALALNSTNYSNALGQEFKISKFNYYLSNIKLKNENGTIYTVPQAESYFLIKETDADSKEIELSNIPEGNYTDITFTIGVDSLRSTMPIADRTGVLDPAAGGQDMYWMWNSGYVFMKMEGTSPVAPLDTVTNTRPFEYHIGGFGGFSSSTINNIKTVSLNFNGEKALVRQANSSAPEVHTIVDAAKVLNGTTNVSFATNPVVMFNAYSVNIANNYASMFRVDHVHN